MKKMIKLLNESVKADWMFFAAGVLLAIAALIISAIVVGFWMGLLVSVVVSVLALLIMLATNRIFDLTSAMFAFVGGLSIWCLSVFIKLFL